MTSAFKFLKTNDLVFYPYDAKTKNQHTRSIKAAQEYDDPALTLR
jgi:hypothetical protein